MPQQNEDENQRNRQDWQSKTADSHPDIIVRGHCRGKRDEPPPEALKIRCGQPWTAHVESAKVSASELAHQFRCC